MTTQQMEEKPMTTFTVRTPRRSALVDITAEVQAAVAASGVVAGACVVVVPHTTAGITINENADPSVRADVLEALDRMVPWDGPYTHAEGNSAAHVKAALVGNSVTVIVEDGALSLGTWQGIYFCEFDGPRTRSVGVQFVASA
jgi:secondary thiamine-phosphate synthase enzyme